MITSSRTTAIEEVSKGVEANQKEASSFIIRIPKMTLTVHRKVDQEIEEHQTETGVQGKQKIVTSFLCTFAHTQMPTMA